MQGNIGATEGGLHFCEEEEINPFHIGNSGKFTYSVRSRVRYKVSFSEVILISFRNLFLCSGSDLVDCARRGAIGRL